MEKAKHHNENGDKYFNVYHTKFKGHDVIVKCKDLMPYFFYVMRVL